MTNNLHKFYTNINQFIKNNGIFKLAEVDGYRSWPKLGVYIFFDESEPVSYPDLPGRIVRVGSQKVNKSSKNSTLWGRLKQHKGITKSGGGNHRGSVFRQHVGFALGKRCGCFPEFWGKDKAPIASKIELHEHEQKVSKHIRNLPFTIIAVDDTGGEENPRAVFERELIAYLSWAAQAGYIEIGQDWLGLSAKSEAIPRSGLWNVEHVWQPGDPMPLHPNWPILK